ncbi:hypothetical protein Vretimale_6518 [Volvox reticuliferus]|uniref:Uncharacterized protein n=1 Tax=Volvox reticuliferus TaxID=1737510 RepID=A0A8J4CDB6_9CHLO|nr:hypothetical protein Vretifemale_7414 [Volvox reticuliferus]GIM01731.1 hypothetical protein Vretimale_6518 [Volvox reticuliferus]
MATTTRTKAPVPMSVLQLLLGWLWRKGLEQPEREVECPQDACWLVLGLFGMLRWSELGGRKVRHVVPLSGRGFEVKIVRSKTDQRGEEASVWLAEVTRS